MNIAVVGTGYVGLVAGACFAETGNDVICVDNDAQKVEALKRGEIPIYEPGLADLVLSNTKRNRLSFTTSLKEGVERSEIIFIAVGTPQDEGANPFGQHLPRLRVLAVEGVHAERRTATEHAGVEELEN